MGRPENGNPSSTRGTEDRQENPVCISVCAGILVSLLLNSADDLYFECIEDGTLPDSGPNEKITYKTWKDGFFLEDNDKVRTKNSDHLRGLSKLSLHPQLV